MSVPESWRLKKRRYSLIGVRCTACNTLFFPPRSVCSCGSENTEPYCFSGLGAVVSYTIIHVAPSGFENNTPYTIALVKLDEGPVITAEIVGVENVVIGMRVRSVFRRLQKDETGVISYGFKFTPAF